jgi:hypothetical protein
MTMSTPVRVLAFAAALAAAFALAFGVGRAVDPDTAPVAEHESGAGHDAGAGHGGHDEPAGPVHLALAQRSLAPGAGVPVSFQVQDAAGEPVTAYDVEHEKELHLIVLGTQDLTDFQHVHPTRAADGTWTVDLKLAPGTSYRLYADGSTGGAGFLATADLFTTGSRPPARPVPEAATTDQVAGFTVELDESDGAAALQVTRGGKPVELEPYLGALGHLVVIRVDDLSYLHVHPEEGDTPVFGVAGLAPGRYRYFFDFQVDGVVHTAAFTHDAAAASSGTGLMDMEEDGHDGH